MYTRQHYKYGDGAKLYGYIRQKNRRENLHLSSIQNDNSSNNNKPGKHSIDSLQKNSHSGNIAHTKECYSPKPEA
jgi:hypothetical protein